MLSVPFNLHSPLHYPVSFLPVCPSAGPSVCLSYRFHELTPLLLRFRLCPLASATCSVPICSICLDRHPVPELLRGLARFVSREDGRLRSPPGISLCHQRSASTLRRSRRHECHRYSWPLLCAPTAAEISETTGWRYNCACSQTINTFTFK